MPTINHNNLGDVQKHAYLFGTITQIYPESDDVPEEYWDTADVLVDDYYYTWEYAPIFYHCYNDAVARDNGAIKDGAKGFAVGDRVFLICEIITPSVGGTRQIDNVKIIGHEKGPVKCAYNYVLVRCSLSSLEELDLDDPAKNVSEQCIIFDVRNKDLASIPDPDAADSTLTFPCPVNKVKTFLLNVTFQGINMWTEYPQGDDDIQIAGGVPNWTSDISGNDLRDDIEAKDWWTTYNINGNPVQNMFEDVCLALMTDDDGASAGTYADAQAILDDAEAMIQTWNSNSSGFVVDERSYSVSGPKDLDLKYALGVDGKNLGPATSRHIQAAYGEDEIWMCIVNTYMGMIIKYCTEANLFTRTPKLYDAIPIPGVIENYEQVASDTALAGVATGSSIASGLTIADIATALAATITLQGKGDENNLYSWATLKRINEGVYHRTIHPAITGSAALRTTAIPNDNDNEPAYLSALNLRKDIVRAWYRYDNWNNTIGYITYSYGVSPTWWFRCAAQQFGCETVYLDTPLGSMWLKSPAWKGFVYLLYALQVGSVTMTARQDKSIQEGFQKICKHSHNVACQVYVVQRTGLTLWAVKSDIFVKQTTGVDPYDTVLYEEDGKDPVAYAKMSDGSYKHYDDLTDEEINHLVSDRVFIYSGSESTSESLRSSRNEVEIMAAADLYSDLFADFDRRNPVDQERSPELEAAIATLIKAVTNTADSCFAPIYLDIEIL